MGYFWNFCAKHGRPVDDGRRLLFPDGWAWGSNRDYAGPEVAPPKDERELLELRLMYWGIRAAEVRAEHTRFVEHVRVLHEAGRSRSAELAVETWEANAAGYLRRGAANLDWFMLEQELRQSGEELRDAETTLENIKKELLQWL